MMIAGVMALVGFVTIATGGLERTVEPATTPISLDQARSQTRIFGTASDVELTDAIEDAVSWVERETRRQLISATYKLYLDCFPYGDVIRVPKPPLQSVTSITYLDTDGASQTLASSVYDVDAKSQPGRIALAFGQSWPSVRADVVNAVTITFVAGYGATAAAVPAEIRRALRMRVNRWFVARGDPDSDPSKVAAEMHLIDPYVVREVA